MRRRGFMRSGMLAAGVLLLAGCHGSRSEGGPGSPAPDDGRTWVMPDEGGPHRRTWMAFGASEAIWGRQLLPQVRADLATIATAIARFEPVSMLVRAEDLDTARGLLSGANVELVTAELDDLWVRDTGPVFVKGTGAKAGVDFHFNGWGGKQQHRRDGEVAAFVAGRAGVETVRTDLVLEGGALEVDGGGTAIITESCVLNDNRNKGWTKAEVEDELRRVLGIEKVIWLPGIAGHDITDGHTDFYARFARPGVVVAGLDNDEESFDYDVTRRHLEILHHATDAKGRPLEIETLEAPSDLRYRGAGDDFAAGYINFYVCNGGVIAPQFGDARTDAAAKDTLRRLFPDREVVQIAIDGIAAGGGGIHCATQQEPVD
ncbi:agmatine deiminase family protein [Nocardia yunnanensis]|uniref:Agmatine deiminase family protein n=1 Tax=Nocardia yunnanensis TaxID=2382165 RepID=A0A386ZHM3_9NOCA|nr:agmatine deiminase family protein [Nocardia yunnanensis]AYF76693.1 agmatine deiminase family protein [Nocardia yunnanensis]